MSVLDAPLRGLAKNLIGKFGAEGLIEYTVTGSYNTTTGKASQSAPTSATASGTIEDFSRSEIDGTTVLRGDFKWTIAAKDVTRPSPNDMVTLDSVRHTVISASSIYSGEQAALHVLQLRR